MQATRRWPLSACAWREGGAGAAAVGLAAHSCAYLRCANLAVEGTLAWAACAAWAAVLRAIAAKHEPAPLAAERLAAERVAARQQRVAPGAGLVRRRAVNAG